MGDYRCGFKLKLRDEDREKAKTELGEDSEQVASHINALRASLTGLKHLKAPDNDDFLLLFLRRAKFSQMKAGQLIDDFIKCRLTPPFNEVYVSSPALDPQVRKVYEAGVCFAIPKLDQLGVRTVVFRANVLNLEEFSFRDAMRAALALVEVILQDPVTQVNGIQFVIDDYEASRTYYRQLMSPTTTRIAASAFLSTIPGRMKGLHICRGPVIVNAAISLLKTFVSSKIGSRLNVHWNTEALCKVVDPAVVPNELGGTAGTYEELTRESNDYVLKHLEYFDRYASIAYDADKKVDEVSGTFRKLAVS